MLHFNRVTKIYDNRIVAVNDVDFKVDEGEFVFLIGPSGSGKTTVMKMLIRDETPTAGKVFFNDNDITKISRSKVYRLRREIGVIFQDFKLIQDKTAYENVAFAMEVAGKKNKEIKEKVPYVLDIVGLSHRLNNFPRQLSGGEQQRVAIARAIANSPKLLVADEPTGNLDPASAWDIVQILSKINDWGTTVVMSTHGTDIVNSLNKRVIQMEGGRIIRDDNKGQYEMSQNFEKQMVKASDEEFEKNKGKKKKSIKLNLSQKDKSEEPRTNNQENTVNKTTDESAQTATNDSNANVEPTKRGLFSKLFGRKDQAEESTLSNNGTEDLVNQKLSLKSSDEDNQKVEEVIQEEDKRELKIEITKPEESKSEEESTAIYPTMAGKNKKSKKKIEAPKEEEIHHIEIKLPESSEKSKPEESEESSEEKKEKTSITELSLSKKVINNLKLSGYKYIEDIVEDGPEGLKRHINIEDDEIVKIAEEIKKFAEKK